jgi:beta-lactamase regulating signal transducer with metallopeptidase domain
MTIVEILLKASLLIGLAALAQALLTRRTSAAVRHLIWTFAIAGLLLLPLLAAALPEWTALELTAPPARLIDAIVDSTGNTASAPVDTAPDTSGITSMASESTTPADVRIRWSIVLMVLYVAGVVLLLARAAAERMALQRLARRATPVSDPIWTALLKDCSDALGVRRPVRLVRTLERTMPMASGIRHAVILLPAAADDWTDDRRRAVLLHELAHVARHDCLTQTLAVLACALYWVHPGVWWVARRLRLERELACDDRVLAAGAIAADYAGHLLEIAYSFGRSPAPAVAVTMAGSRQLEGRLLAVLDAARNRAAPAFRGRIAGLIILAALLVPIAAATTVIVSSGDGVESPGSVQAGGGQSESTELVASQTGASTQESARELLPGTWEIRPAEEPGRVHLQLREGHSFYGFTIDVERLSGLAPAQLAGGGPMQFSIRRDAGTFTFEGVARKGVAAGTFDFIPDATFSAELGRRGFTKPTAAQQHLLARVDLGFAFIDELNTQGYRRPDLTQLIRAAEHGVTLSYLRDMGQLGYRVGQIDRLVELREHDVTPAFIRGLAAQGLRGLPADDLIRARSHDVTPEYVSGLAAVGYKALALDRLITLRSNDVTREYVRGLAAHGYGPFDLETIVDLRNHDVSAEFVEGLSGLGYRRLPTEVLLRLRSHDVMPAYVRELQTLGYRGLGVEELLTLRGHDVQPRYVEALQGLGYRGLRVEDLVDLRAHDVQPEEIRRANDRAGRQLTVDRLTELASNDWR